MQVDRLIITRKSANHWVYVLNDEPGTRDANAYTGNRNGNFITINTITGAIILPSVYYGNISYYDQTDPGNNMVNPVSAEILQGYLIAQGFFKDTVSGGSGSGSGGVDQFKQLTDTFPSFTGRNGQLLYIDGLYVNSMENPAENISFEDLVNWRGGTLQPNQYILSSSQINPDGSSIGLVQSSINNIINRPPAFNEIRIDYKGYNWTAGNPPTGNLEEYSMQPGDLISKWFILPYSVGNPEYPYGRIAFMLSGRWNGGDVNSLDSFADGHIILYQPFTTDPDYIT